MPKGFVFISVKYRLHPRERLQEATTWPPRWPQHKAARPPGAATRRSHSHGALGRRTPGVVQRSPTLAQREGAWPWLGTVSLDSAALNVPAVMAAPHYAFYDEVMGSNPVFWTAVSPYHALAGAVPPFQLVCSTERPDHPCLQAQGMARRMQQLGGRAEVLPQELSHGEINAQLGLESAYTRAVEAFMASLDPVVAQRLR